MLRIDGNITKYQTQYDAVTNATGCGNATNTLQCLRELPFETLNLVLNSSVTSNDVSTIHKTPLTKSIIMLNLAPGPIPNDR